MVSQRFIKNCVGVLIVMVIIFVLKRRYDTDTSYSFSSNVESSSSDTNNIPPRVLVVTGSPAAEPPDKHLVPTGPTQHEQHNNAVSFVEEPPPLPIAAAVGASNKEDLQLHYSAMQGNKDDINQTKSQPDNVLSSVASNTKKISVKPSVNTEQIVSEVPNSVASASSTKKIAVTPSVNTEQIVPEVPNSEYKPMFLVRKDKNLIFNDVVASDVLPGYFNISTQNNTAQFEKHLQDTEDNINDRKRNVEEHCKTKSKHLKRRQNYLYHFPDHNVTWCPVFKAGSTNWKMFFCRQYKPELYEQHIQNKSALYCELNYFSDHRQKDWKYGSNDWSVRVRESLKFITVRHPYERLVSAYKNKFENCRNQRFTNSHMLDILRRYRKVEPGTTKEDKEKLLEDARLQCNKEKREVDLSNPYMDPMGPMFKEFIQYITDNFRNGIWPDFHWIPISKGCDLCIVQYDVIEKFETLERDHHFLLYKLGRPELLPLIAHAHSNPSGNTRAELFKYFDSLDETLLWFLAAVYKDDFDLFGYKPHFMVRRNPTRQN